MSFIMPPFWARPRVGVYERWRAVLVTPAVAIVASSIASPTVITTLVPHGLASDDTATIANHAGSTPAVSGHLPVTVLTPTSFTVPVAVTVAGTGGTVTRTLAAPVIALADAKLHTRLGADVAAEDPLVVNATKAARRQVENDSGQILLPETFDVVGEAFPASSGPIVLPVGPLASVLSIQSYDTAAVLQTMASTDYIPDVVSIPGRIGLADAAIWPSDLRLFQPVSLRVIVGYASISAIPEPLLQAVRNAIAWHVAYREPTAMELTSYNWLIDSFRSVVVA